LRQIHYAQPPRVSYAQQDQRYETDRFGRHQHFSWRDSKHPYLLRQMGLKKVPLATQLPHHFTT
jgi:hypothetical protein